MLGTSLVLLGAGLLSRVLPLLGGERRLFGQFPSEDAYLMLTVARNLALGLGPTTADGTIATNGIQPLATLLWAGVFALTDGDRASGIRVVLVLEILLSTLFPLLLFLLGRRVLEGRPWAVGAPLLAAAVWYASPLAMRISMNCQETGLYAVAVLAVVWTALDLEERPSWLRVAVLGLLLGVTFWIRNDAVFLVAAVGVLHLVRGLSRPAPRPWRPVGELAVMGAVALAVALPWLVYNQVFFGSIVPISGQAQSVGVEVGSNLRVLPAMLAGYLLTVVWIPATVEMRPATSLLGAPFVLAGLLALGWAVPRSTRRERDLLILVGVFAAGLLVYYGAFFGVPFFLKRYLFPVFAFVVLAVCVGLCALGRRLRAGRAGAAPALLAAAALVVWIGASHRALHLMGARHGHWPMVEWVKENVPESEWVGALQSGTLGFFHDRTLNLDGKVNPAALRAQREGRLGRYVLGTEVRWLVDWPILMRVHALPIVAANFDAIVNDPARRLVVLRRRDADRRDPSEPGRP